MRFNEVNKFCWKFCSSFLLYSKNWHHGAHFLYQNKHLEVILQAQTSCPGVCTSFYSYSLLRDQNKGRKDFAHMEFQIEIPIISSL